MTPQQTGGERMDTEASADVSETVSEEEIAVPPQGRLIVLVFQVGFQS